MGFRRLGRKRMHADSIVLGFILKEEHYWDVCNSHIVKGRTRFRKLGRKRSHADSIALRSILGESGFTG